MTGPWVYRIALVTSSDTSSWVVGTMLARSHFSSGSHTSARASPAEVSSPGSTQVASWLPSMRLSRAISTAMSSRCWSA